MKYALFAGCKAGYDVPQYQRSAKAVLSKLGVKFKELDFNCCGYSVREKNLDAFLLLAIRNLAIARAYDLPVLALCKCCFGSLKHADYYFKQYPDRQKVITDILKKEGLSYDGSTRIVHVLTLLDNHLDAGRIQGQISRKMSGLKVAPHYGCHALRPSHITGFDNPLAPTIFERLISLTGAEVVDWPRRLECCGDPLRDKNSDLSARFFQQKTKSAQQSGADIISSACSHCQIQFDHGRSRALADGLPEPIPSVLITQLLGLAMGVNEAGHGIDPGLYG